MENAANFFGILCDLTHGHAVQNGKERLARLLEHGLQAATARDQAGVRLHIEALEQLAIFHMAHDFSDAHVRCVFRKIYATSAATDANQPTRLGEILCHFGEMVQRDAVGICHLAR